jgi:hypothetical protein
MRTIKLAFRKSEPLQKKTEQDFTPAPHKPSRLLYIKKEKWKT